MTSGKRLLHHLIVVPPLRPADRSYMGIPGRFALRAAVRKAVHGKIGKVFLSSAPNLVPRGRGNPHNVSGPDWKGLRVLVSDEKGPFSLGYKEHLFRVFVAVKVSRFPGVDHDVKDFTTPGFGTIKQQIIDMGWKLITL